MGENLRLNTQRFVVCFERVHTYQLANTTASTPTNDSNKSTKTDNRSATGNYTKNMVSDYDVTCTLAFLQEDSVSKALSCAFGNSLVFGSGRLISAAPAQAGKQIAVCVASRGRRFDVSCT